jgi:hypothetical protein
VTGQISLQAIHMQLTGRPVPSKSSNSILRNVTTLKSLHLGHRDETYVLSIMRRWLDTAELFDEWYGDCARGLPNYFVTIGDAAARICSNT